MRTQTHEAIVRYLEQAIDCIKRDNPAGTYGAMEAAKALLDYEATYK